MKKLIFTLTLFANLITMPTWACPGAGQIFLTVDLGQGPVTIGYVNTYDATVTVSKGFKVVALAGQWLPLSGTPMTNICANRGFGGIASCDTLERTPEGDVIIPEGMRSKYSIFYVILSQNKYSGDEAVKHEIAFQYNGGVNLEPNQPRARGLGCGGGGEAVGTFPYLQK